MQRNPNRRFLPYSRPGCFCSIPSKPSPSPMSPADRKRSAYSFVLGGVCCSIPLSEKRERREPGKLLMVPILILFGAAILTKEHTAVLPALLLLTDYYWNPGFSFEGIRRNWKLYVPILIGGAIAAVFIFRVLGQSPSAGFGMKDLTWYEYFFTAVPRHLGLLADVFAALWPEPGLRCSDIAQPAGPRCDLWVDRITSRFRTRVGLPSPVLTGFVRLVHVPDSFGTDVVVRTDPRSDWRAPFCTCHSSDCYSSPWNSCGVGRLARPPLIAVLGPGAAGRSGALLSTKPIVGQRGGYLERYHGEVAGEVAPAIPIGVRILSRRALRRSRGGVREGGAAGAT